MSKRHPAPTPAPTPSASCQLPTGRRYERFLPLLLLFAGLLVYLNSLSGQFIYDDIDWIQNYAPIRHLWPADYFHPSFSRWFVQFTLALNFAFDKAISPLVADPRGLDGGVARYGLHVEGYHLFNLLVHVAAGLTLFGILRRTLAALPGRFSPRAASGLAFLVALLWIVHPLQTQAVSYVIQRSESLAGLFYMFALYAAIRLFEGGRLAWALAAGLACVLGDWTKEIIVTAPILILLYDRAFASGSFAAALRRHWQLYLALAASWALLAYITLAGTINLALTQQQGTAGAALPQLSKSAYLVTQSGIILHYLRLAIFPHPLIFDYVWQPYEPMGQTFLQALCGGPGAAAWPVVRNLALTAQVIVVGGLCLFSLWLLWRRPKLGFLAFAFFLLLAPTSSLLPIADLAVEHRMYLPLAPLLTLLIVGAYLAWVSPLRPGGTAAPAPPGWRPLALLALAFFTVLAFSARTILRNADYANSVALWQSVVAARPANPRGHLNLAEACVRQNFLPQAQAQYEEALRLRRAVVLPLADQKTDIVIETAQDGLIGVLLRRNQVGRAIAELDAALQARAGDAKLLFLRGQAAGYARHPDEAAQWYEQALIALDRQNRGAAPPGPGFSAQVYAQLGRVEADLGRIDAAKQHLLRATELAPNYSGAHAALASILRQQGQFDAAIAHYRQALRPDADLPEIDDTDVLSALGETLLHAGRTAEARACFDRAVAFRPEDPLLASNLALIDLAEGRPDAALARLLALPHQHPEVARRLVWLLATAPDAARRQPARALELAETLRDIMGAKRPEYLQVQAAAYAAAGRFADALATAATARARAVELEQTRRVAALDEQIAHYQRKEALVGGMVP